MYSASQSFIGYEPTTSNDLISQTQVGLKAKVVQALLNWVTVHSELRPQGNGRTRQRAANTQGASLNCSRALRVIIRTCD